MRFFALLLVVFHEVIAAVALGTGAAVFRRLADGVLGREDFFSLMAQSSHGFEEDIGSAHRDLCGDLQAVEKEPGTARIEARGGKLAEDLGERNLDGAAVLERRQLEVVPDAFGCGGAVKVGVEVAVGHFAQGRRVAPGSAGHDVTAFVVHDSSYPLKGSGQGSVNRPYPLPGFCKEIPYFQIVTGGVWL